MSSKKIDKEALKGPDVFVSTSDKIFNFIEHHLKTALGVLALVGIGSVGYVVYGYINASQEQKAAEALYHPESLLKKAESEVREQRAKKMQDLAGGKEKAKDKKTVHEDLVRPADYEKDYAPFVEKIKAELRDHANTKAALISALNLSYFLTQQKQFPQALEVLNMPKYRPQPTELLGGFWLMHRGVILLENNQVDGAIESYQSVIQSAPLKAFHPEALLKLGVCFELKGDAGKARETYEKVARDFPESEASMTAQQYLRLLDLKSAKG